MEVSLVTVFIWKTYCEFPCGEWELDEHSQFICEFKIELKYCMIHLQGIQQLPREDQWYLA